MDISSPQISKRSGPSIIWLIPLVTMLVGGWLIMKTLSEQGPRVTISFKTAEGIEVGKTRVKYKNVDIGVVEQIKFGEDFSSVILTVQFDRDTDNFLRRNTRFWVVKPQLSLRGATGLSTLISGAYIEIEPGPGARQTHFIGLEKQPVVNADEQGKEIVLVTQNLGSIDTGSPIYYQGLLAGEVLGHDLGNDRKSIYIYAFIKDPFDQIISGNTKFWNVSGFDISLNADGFKLQTQSIRSMMFGGIAFETPETLEQITTDVNNLVFTLYDSYESIREHDYSKKIKFIMYFDNSVRGLSLNAPVEFKGIRVGTVVDVRLEFNSEDSSFRIPVLVEIEPQRVIDRSSGEADTAYETLNRLVERGLRARLQTGSLLTGQLYVELDMFPDSPVNLVAGQTRYPELPTLPTSSFSAITAQAEELLSKINSIDLVQLADGIIETINNVNKLVSAPGLQETVSNLQASMVSFRSIMQKVDESNLQEAINAGHQVLDNLDHTLDKANLVLDPNAPMHYNLIKLTGELEETARSIRSLVEILERNPQALLFGKDNQAEGEGE